MPDDGILPARPTDGQSDAPPSDGGSPPRSSDLLRHIVAQIEAPRVSIDHLMTVLAERGFGMVLTLLALASLIPGPPGLGALFGPPILLVGLQMTVDAPRPWLPRVVLRKTVARADLDRLLEAGTPVLARLERLFRPRADWAAGRRAKAVIGVVVMSTAVAIMVPLPLTNFIPALGLLVIALALVERDGILAAVGLVLAMLAVLAVGLLSAALLGGMIDLVMRLAG